MLAMFFLGTATAQQQYVSKTSSHCVCFPSPLNSKAAATTQQYVSEAQPGRRGDKNLQAKLIRHGPAKEHVRQTSATNFLADFNNGTCLLVNTAGKPCTECAANMINRRKNSVRYSEDTRISFGLTRTWRYMPLPIETVNLSICSSI